MVDPADTLPADGLTPPQAYNPWDTWGDATTGITGPAPAVFPYISNPPSPPTPGVPQIAVALSEPVDPAALASPPAALLSVWRAQLLQYEGRHPVPGAWAVAAGGDPLGPPDVPAGCGLVFTPSQPTLMNNRYVVHVGRGLPMASGARLGAGFESHFLSKLTPFYCDPYMVLNKLGEFGAKVSDEQLYYEIWQASVTCNRHTMLYVPMQYVAGPSSQQVIAWQFNRTYAMDEFVKVEACLQVARNLLLKFVDEVDRKAQGIDFATEVEDGLIRNLRAAVVELQRERDPLLAEISKKKARIASTQKSGTWPGVRRGPGDRSYAPRRSF